MSQAQAERFTSMILTVDWDRAPTKDQNREGFASIVRHLRKVRGIA
jgi:hypothetical protein